MQPSSAHQNEVCRSQVWRKTCASYIKAEPVLERFKLSLQQQFPAWCNRMFGRLPDDKGARRRVELPYGICAEVVS